MTCAKFVQSFNFQYIFSEALTLYFKGELTGTINLVN